MGFIFVVLDVGSLLEELSSYWMWVYNWRNFRGFGCTFVVFGRTFWKEE
jgi:hypothetical protein